MMQNRRDLLKTALLASGAAAVASAAPTANANWGMPVPTSNTDRRSLINIPHAYKVLDEHKLDGLVALNPVNVFYLGNHLGFNVKIQTPNPSFAVFPRDPSKPTLLVVGLGDVWNIANAELDIPNIIPYSIPLNWQDYLGKQQAPITPAATDGFSTFFERDETSLSKREAAWLKLDQAFKGRFEPTAQHALVTALKEAGLEKATVAIDDLRIDAALASVGHDTTKTLDADNVFRKIRVVKSPVEIAHMRHIAQINQQATVNALRQVDVGATNADLDHVFRVEAAKLGATVTWATAGSIGGFPSAEIVKDEPFMVDAVSQINYYHGDFGRSVVAGEPSKKLLERANVLSTGWQAALNMMRPGVKYSDIQAAAMAAMQGATTAKPNILVSPHSVGLQHTDEPYRDNLPFMVKDDLVLQEGMTLTVDFPSLEIGWGHCHLEDLVVITKDGVEALGTIDNALITI